MNKQELLDNMSVSELRDEIYKKQVQESIDKFSTRKEAEFNLSEVKTLEADGSGTLYHVRVHDGCEGWEALVEIDREVVDEGYYDGEDLVKDHLINFMIDNNYYEPGDIEDICVEEICRYNRPIFKIHTDKKEE
jgi:hypothetical protein